MRCSLFLIVFLFLFLFCSLCSSCSSCSHSVCFFVVLKVIAISKSTSPSAYIYTAAAKCTVIFVIIFFICATYTIHFAARRTETFFISWFFTFSAATICTAFWFILWRQVLFTTRALQLTLHIIVRIDTFCTIESLTTEDALR